MAQAKRKQATKTAKKATAKKSTGKAVRSHGKACSCAKCSNSMRNHIYVVTAMSMIAGLLLCINVVMMMS